MPRIDKNYFTGEIIKRLIRRTISYRKKNKEIVGKMKKITLHYLLLNKKIELYIMLVNFTKLLNV